MVRQRVRLYFTKSGTLKFIGHNDLLRNFEMLFRRAGLRLAMSEGFHPKIKMSSPSALALGIEGFSEILELEFEESAEPVIPDALLAVLNRHSVPGLQFVSAALLPEGTKKAQLVSSVYEVQIPEGLLPATAEKVRYFMEQDTVSVEKSSGKNVDVRKAIAEITLNEKFRSLFVEILTQHGPEAGIKEVLTVLGLSGELFKTVFPKRILCKVR
ncbi:MAG: TIGR03936 family radical SAM-associated protein [Planctomycetaceae bacterium]|jgi:radical SAM-linked protein|nr:TIGR03936 family radical SAM-associated protein [Planctomycetaceae bacterium]